MIYATITLQYDWPTLGANRHITNLFIDKHSDTFARAQGQPVWILSGYTEHSPFKFLEHLQRTAGITNDDIRFIQFVNDHTPEWSI